VKQLAPSKPAATLPKRKRPSKSVRAVPATASTGTAAESDIESMVDDELPERESDLESAVGDEQ
jgi:hypothetical protein